jgi:hypothetical protein
VGPGLAALGPRASQGHAFRAYADRPARHGGRPGAAAPGRARRGGARGGRASSGLSSTAICGATRASGRCSTGWPFSSRRGGTRRNDLALDGSLAGSRSVGSSATPTWPQNAKRGASDLGRCCRATCLFVQWEREHERAPPQSPNTTLSRRARSRRASASAPTRFSNIAYPGPSRPGSGGVRSFRQLPGSTRADQRPASARE